MARRIGGFPDVRERFAEQLGRLAGLYGVNPLLGRLYAVLLLAAAPLSLDEVTEAAGTAKSTASVALRNLEKYRVVRRHWRKSDRRTFYTARTDFTAMLGEWYSLFLERDIAQFTALCQEAREGLKAAHANPGGPDAADVRELVGRLDGLAGWLTAGARAATQASADEGRPRLLLLAPAEPLPIEVSP